MLQARFMKALIAVALVVLGSSPVAASGPKKLCQSVILQGLTHVTEFQTAAPDWLQIKIVEMLKTFEANGLPDTYPLDQNFVQIGIEDAIVQLLEGIHLSTSFNSLIYFNSKRPEVRARAAFQIFENTVMGFVQVQTSRRGDHYALIRDSFIKIHKETAQTFYPNVDFAAFLGDESEDAVYLDLFLPALTSLNEMLTFRFEAPGQKLTNPELRLINTISQALFRLTHQLKFETETVATSAPIQEFFGHILNLDRLPGVTGNEGAYLKRQV